MFCKKCDKEIEDNSLFCTFCGTEQGAETRQQDGNASSIFHNIFSSNNFHLLTVFYLVSVCASALATTVAGNFPLPIIEIFILIALFKLKKLAKQNSPLSDFASPLKTFRVIIKIYQLFSWVAVGIFGVCGIIMFIASGIVANGIGEFAEEYLNEANFSFLGSPLSLAGGIAFSVIGIILIVIAVIVALLTVFMYGSFFKTAESAEISAKTGDIYIAAIDSTKTWLVIVAVLEGLSAVSDTTDGPSAVLSLVAVGFMIAFLVLANKMLENLKNYRQNEIL